MFIASMALSTSALNSSAVAVGRPMIGGSVAAAASSPRCRRQQARRGEFQHVAQDFVEIDAARRFRAGFAESRWRSVSMCSLAGAQRLRQHAGAGRVAAAAGPHDGRGHDVHRPLESEDGRREAFAHAADAVLLGQHAPAGRPCAPSPARRAAADRRETTSSRSRLSWRAQK